MGDNMRLRNKKTGEIIEGKCFTDIVKKLHDRGDPICSGPLLSIALFEQYWKEIDEYKPAEPLIDNEEIREIIRAWAKANDATELKYYEGENCLEDIFRNEIHFNQALGLEDGHSYTITELCGEEEAPEPIEPTSIDLDERIKEKGEE